MTKKVQQQVTKEQEQQALNRAIVNFNQRVDRRARLRKEGKGNSFEAIGNDKCLSRLDDTIKAMERGTASSRQIKHWLHR